MNIYEFYLREPINYLQQFPNNNKSHSGLSLSIGQVVELLDVVCVNNINLCNIRVSPKKAFYPIPSRIIETNMEHLNIVKSDNTSIRHYDLTVKGPYVDIEYNLHESEITIKEEVYIIIGYSKTNYKTIYSSIFKYESNGSNYEEINPDIIVPKIFQIKVVKLVKSDNNSYYRKLLNWYYDNYEIENV